MEAYSHMVEKCEHSEVNGKNRKGFDGKNYTRRRGGTMWNGDQPLTAGAV